MVAIGVLILNRSGLNFAILSVTTRKEPRLRVSEPTLSAFFSGVNT